MQDFRPWAKDTTLAYTALAVFLVYSETVGQALTLELLRRTSRDGAASTSLTEDGPKKRVFGQW